MIVYPFVEAEQAGQRNVARACAMLEVSRAAYYQWPRHTPSVRAREDEVLRQRIERIHDGSRGTYGAPRVLAQLQRDGIRVGRRRVGRLMRQRGLVGRRQRRFKRTTIPDPAAETVAVDLLQRNFDVATLALNQTWCGDISYLWTWYLWTWYLWTWEGWVHLATVLGRRPAAAWWLGGGRAHAHDAGQ